MIDIELFRKDPDIFREEIKKRGIKIDTSEGISLDKERRELTFRVDELRAKKNEASKIIPTLQGDEKNKLISQMQDINTDLERFETKNCLVHYKWRRGDKLSS